VDLSVLTEKDELQLAKQLGEYPAIVEQAAAKLEPHRVVAYLEGLAKSVNSWYHRHRVIGAPDGLEQARLVLARAAQIVVANGLNLLGITAPERM
jgi:arginyl-tRNA synthetase